MYEIHSDFIIQPKEKYKTQMTFKTTQEVDAIIRKISKQNEMTVSAVINTAIVEFLINNVKNVKP